MEKRKVNKDKLKKLQAEKQAAIDKNKIVKK
jgi:hypothetical protein